MKGAIVGSVGSGIALGSVAIERHMQIAQEAEIWLRLLTLVIGCAGGIIGLLLMLRLDALKRRRERAQLCKICIETDEPPLTCPIPIALRPMACPLLHRRVPRR